MNIDELRRLSRTLKTIFSGREALSTVLLASLVTLGVACHGAGYDASHGLPRI
jgi:hypothetical protein